MSSCLIYISFVIVSISSMFSNNAFMNAHEYFYYKLRNVTNDENGFGNLTTRLKFWPEFGEDSQVPTKLQAEFEAYLTVFGGAACVLGNIFNFVTTKTISNFSRVIWGHIFVILAFIPTIALTYMDYDHEQEFFFNISMFLISIACFGSLGLIAGGVLGLSSLFPAKYTQAVMIGQSLSGVLATVVSILCQTITSNVVLNGQIYFVFTVVMTVLSICSYVYLANISPPLDMLEETRERLIDDHDVENEIVNSNFPPIDERPIEMEPTSMGTVWIQVQSVIDKASIDLTTVSLVLLVTLAAYPGLTSLVKSTSRNHTWNAYFSAVASFLLYNVIDLVGRSTANSFRLSSKCLLLLAFLRFLLIPLIAACNISPRHHTTSLLPYDGVFILLIIVLAASHGFCITNATISATSRVERNNRELAGSITSLLCVTAATVGGIFGVLVLKMI